MWGRKDLAMQNDFRYAQSYQTARLALVISRVLKLLAGIVASVACVFIAVGMFSRNPAPIVSGISLFAMSIGLFVSGVLITVLGRLLIMLTDVAIQTAQGSDAEKSATVARLDEESRDWFMRFNIDDQM